MIFATIAEQKQSRSFVQAFRGYNNNLRIEEDEFADTKNLSCELYPLLTTRKKRSVKTTLTNGRGLIAKDALAWIDGTKLFYNGAEVPGIILNNNEPKQLISIGAYICIFPDKVYVNTKDLTEYGSMEASFTSSSEVTLTLCKRDGTPYEEVNTEAPIAPKNGDLWLDTSVTPHILKQYSETSAMWVQIPTVYVRIAAAGIDSGFEEGDGVNIEGLSHEDSQINEQLKDINGSKVIQSKGDGYIVVIGILDVLTTCSTVSVDRKLPDMNYITEAGNRLWGCFYGFSNGKTLNEIYCSKLGDFKNWTCYQGLSTDSWAASIGTDGEFTGAITHLGYPIFFKENCFHKVYVSSEGAHQVTQVDARGIQKGSWRSAVIVNERLYYKSRTDICVYDGSLPAGISDVFGEKKYFDAAAGAIGARYYVSMKDGAGIWHLFVYDIEKGIWIHEDETHASYFAKKDDELYMLCGNDIVAVNGSDGEKEEDFEFSAETGNIGYASPDKKYLSRFNLRMSAEAGTILNVAIQYDSDGVWEDKGSIKGTRLGTFTLPIAPRRCDHCRIRISGKGSFKLYSIAKILEDGSDV